MLAPVRMLFSLSRRTVCRPCFLFLKKIEIFPIYTWFFGNFDFFQKQETRCANCAPWRAEQHSHWGQYQFYFQKLDKVIKYCQSPAHGSKKYSFLSLMRSFPYVAEKIQYFYARCGVGWGRLWYFYIFII